MNAFGVEDGYEVISKRPVGGKWAKKALTMKNVKNMKSSIGAPAEYDAAGEMIKKPGPSKKQWKAFKAYARKNK